MRLQISDILEQASQLPTKQEKIDFLQKHYSIPLTYVIRAALDPTIKWLLPTGSVPYKTTNLPGQEGMLYSEARRLYLFIEGGNPNLTKSKREHLFVQLLEMLSAKDAELIVAAKDKKLPYKGLNVKLFNEAFPNLINEQ